MSMRMSRRERLTVPAWRKLEGSVDRPPSLRGDRLTITGLGEIHIEGGGPSERCRAATRSAGAGGLPDRECCTWLRRVDIIVTDSSDGPS